MADRFYVPHTSLSAGSLVELSPEESHHLLRVMRARPGQALRVFNGRQEFTAVLHEVQGQRAIALVETEVPPPPLPAFRSSFLVPWLKAGRSEEVLQKLTELGAAAVIFYVARREVAHLDPGKVARLQRAAAEAAKQCERAELPTVESGGHLASAIALRGLPPSRVLILAERTSSAATLSQALRSLALDSAAPATSSTPGSLGEVLVASGPEGGFHPDELAACASLARFVSLGPRILRAETAPIAAAAAILAAGGDL